MWLIFALLSALFAGLTSILAKCGIKKTDTTLATAIRTVVVLFFSWGFVFALGVDEGLYTIDAHTLFFLVLSGLATGGAWLCYFRALQLGDVNKVVPIDKTSTVLTVVMAFFILSEVPSLYGILGVVLIAIGTALMIEKKDSDGITRHGSWLLFALGSAVFSALTAIFGKIGIEGIESTLGTAVRTGVVLLMSWMMVFVSGKHKEIQEIDKKEIFFLILSGFATGGSWLCFYRALQEGPAHIVVPIDKLSILVAVLFSYIFFGERLNKRTGLGLFLLTLGTVSMIF